MLVYRHLPRVSPVSEVGSASSLAVMSFKVQMAGSVMILSLGLVINLFYGCFLPSADL